MRLAPAVLLNALMVRYLLHGGDPPGVSMESNQGVPQSLRGGGAVERV